MEFILPKYFCTQKYINEIIPGVVTWRCLGDLLIRMYTLWKREISFGCLTV